MTKLFRYDEQDVQVNVQRDGDGYRVSVDGRELPWVVLAETTGWAVDTPEGRRRFSTLVTPDRCDVFAAGRVHSFAKPDPEHDDAEAGAAAGPRLVADMPGKVVKVLVSEGDRVEVGQGLVIMESMKMETELTAAVTGTVSGVEVSAGQVVGQGDLLVEIAADPTDTKS